MNDTPHDLRDLRIREMTPADCRPVAEIRVGGWRAAYAGLVPRSYLDAMDVEQDAEKRRVMLSTAGNPVVNLIAERAGEIVGWAAYGPYRDGEVRIEDAELYALYTRPGHFGSGVGTALLRESAERCTAAGHGAMLLWVLKGNARARRFYAHHGFTADGAEEPFEADGTEVPEVRYVRDLGAQGPSDGSPWEKEWRSVRAFGVRCEGSCGGAACPFAPCGEGACRASRRRGDPSEGP